MNILEELKAEKKIDKTTAEEFFTQLARATHISSVFSFCNLQEELVREGQKISLQNYKLLNKDTSSPSEVIFGNLVLQTMGDDRGYTLPLAGKIFGDEEFSDFKAVTIEIPTFPHEKITIDQGLMYEVYVYSYLYEKVVKKKTVCPNFISYLAYARCENADLIFSQEDLLEDRIKDFLDQYSSGINILITEKLEPGQIRFNQEVVNVTTFHNFFKKNQDVEQTIFQVCYSLYIMNLIDLQHNDFHLGNILVAELKDEIILQYTIEGTLYRFLTKYVPFIYDWDFSFVKILGPNFKTLQFPFIKNEVDPRADFYTFATSTKIITPLTNRETKKDFLTTYKLITPSEVKLPNFELEIVRISSDRKNIIRMPTAGFASFLTHLGVADAYDIMEREFYITPNTDHYVFFSFYKNRDVGSEPLIDFREIKGNRRYVIKLELPYIKIKSLKLPDNHLIKVRGHENVYKASMSLLKKYINSVFPANTNFNYLEYVCTTLCIPSKTTEVLLEIKKATDVIRKEDLYLLMIYAGFQNRKTITTTSFPTPKEYIQVFKDFATDARECVSGDNMFCYSDREMLN